jgi:flavin-dependent dehydrogenase
MNHEKPDVDVGIIGGGPAGASMAAYLAKAGISCTVFESELFPRPHVGESLVPSSTRVFKDLGFLEVMEQRKFIHKFGAGWTSASSIQIYGVDWQGLDEDCEALIRFDEREQPGVNQNYTYHVDRGEFDNALLQFANQLGAQVYEGVRVSGVDFDDGPYPRIKYSVAGKPSHTTCQIVVDASGRRTLLGNQLKIRVKDEVFDQFAIHTWFDGYDRSAWARSEIMKDFIFVHFLPLTNSWVWQIPITHSTTSIGVVTQRKNFPKTQASREEFFWQCVGSRPEVEEKLRSAERVRPFREEGDYSYAMKQLAGDRWVLVGDAGRFVDPIFSTGVSIALNSSRFASRDVIQALETGNFVRSAFENFETTIRRGTKNWYEFITVYYRLNVLFTLFIRDPRYRLDVLKLLQGDVYDEEEPAVLTKMRQKVAEVEQNADHYWHKLLGDLTADAFRPTV